MDLGTSAQLVVGMILIVIFLTMWITALKEAARRRSWLWFTFILLVSVATPMWFLWGPRRRARTSPGKRRGVT